MLAALDNTATDRPCCGPASVIGRDASAIATGNSPSFHLPPSRRRSPISTLSARDSLGPAPPKEPVGTVEAVAPKAPRRVARTDWRSRGRRLRPAGAVGFRPRCLANSRRAPRLGYAGSAPIRSESWPSPAARLSTARAETRHASVKMIRRPSAVTASTVMRFEPGRSDEGRTSAAYFRCSPRARSRVVDSMRPFTATAMTVLSARPRASPPTTTGTTAASVAMLL